MSQNGTASKEFVLSQSINNSAMLVFLMQAGFTMLEAGSVRERNVSAKPATFAAASLPVTTYLPSPSSLPNRAFF
jgi:hypothetical protein